MKNSFVNQVALAVLASILSSEVAVAQTPQFKGELVLEPAIATTRRCLTATSNTDGSTVTMQGCTGAASQHWVFENGSIKVHGNKCLDVKDGVNADGTKLQIWTCGTNNSNQQWYYNFWDNHISWTNRGKCIDVTDGKTSDGTQVQIWSCSGNNANQRWNAGYMANALPQTSQNEQFGTNNCGTTSSQSSNCQTAWINSAEDFCVWAPPSPGTIGDTEREEVAWCTKSGRGTRVIPNGTLKGVHFVETPDYVQITGVGDFTKINILAGDDGGELDNRGADGRGNPIGGLVFGNTFAPGFQYHEWTNFMSSTEFCFRACKGPNATRLCNHIYDVMGCYWNMPANYNEGTFENCKGDNAIPMGEYGTSTWHQGTSPTPGPHPAPSSSQCQSLPTITSSPVRRRSNGGMEKRFQPSFPNQTPAPVV